MPLIILCSNKIINFKINQDSMLQIFKTLKHTKTNKTFSLIVLNKILKIFQIKIQIL